MKIAIVNCFDTYEHRADLLTKYFLDSGNKVNVYTSDFMHIEKKKRIEIKENYTFIKSIPYTKNMSIIRLISHVTFAKDLFKAIKNSEFDLIWILIPPNSFVKEIKKYKRIHKNVKVVVDVIDMWPETMPMKSIYLYPIFYLWRKIRRNSIFVADYVTTECDFYRNILENEFPKERISTIYLARNNRYETLCFDLIQDTYKLCYLGSINSLIDINVIIKIIMQFMKFKPVEVNIIGDGEKRDYFIEEVKKTGANVIFHGKIYDYDKKKMILSNCHYGLNIMKDTVFVGLTMKSIDYFEFGLPIINNIKGDTWDLVNQYKIGYNFDEKSEIDDKYDISMRKNTFRLFNELFTVSTFNRKLNEILRVIGVYL